MSSEGMRPTSNIKVFGEKALIYVFVFLSSLKDLIEKSWPSKAAHIYWLSYMRALYALLSTSNSLTRTVRMLIHIINYRLHYARM